MSDEGPLAGRLLYDATRVVARLAAVGFFRIRTSGRRNFPPEGGGLVCSNHQSFLDPILVGLCCDRPMNYLARDTLFRFKPFARLIETYHAIPIDREGTGLAGIKESLKRLKRGELVLIFPEGTRSADGELLPVQSGVCTLARRAGVPLIPVALDGAAQAWPRTQKLPRPERIGIHVGPPISTEIVRSLDDERLAEVLAGEIAECHAIARRLRRSG